MRKYFFYKILPKVIIMFLFLALLIWVTKPNTGEEPTYCVTNVLAWMLTPPN